MFKFWFILLLSSLVFNKCDSQKYLINTSNCKIPDIEPFNEETEKLYRTEDYMSCSNKPALTFLTKENGSVYLNINKNVLNLYTTRNDSVKCCYHIVTRNGVRANPDVGIRKSAGCRNFTDKIEIISPIIYVKCKDNDSNIYENTHSPIIKTKNIVKKLERSFTSTPISVLLISIDSVSRLNFMRTLPNTRNFLLANDFIEFKGYHRVDENTLQNVLALLTGFNSSHVNVRCDYLALKGLDRCPMIWYDYRDLGYITAYGEDDSLSIFNYKARGFTKPPTNYYFKSYIEASEKLRIINKEGMAYCSGPETSAERILNLIKDFAISFKGHPLFGLFRMSTFSRNNMNTATRMDEKLLKFFSDLKNESIFNDSIVVFHSDHGARFGDIRLTKSGYFEERLPFFLISLPVSFKNKYPDEYRNVVDNANKLTNSFDVYKTLQHVLMLSGLNFKEKASRACPKCTSLFRNIPENRSCEDAAIPDEWCTCFGDLYLNTNTILAQQAVDFILTEIGNILKRKAPGKCATFVMDKVINSFLTESLPYRYLFISFQTIPKAVFIVTVKFINNFENPSIVRLIRFDNYKNSCVSNLSVKKICSCV